MADKKHNPRVPVIRLVVEIAGVVFQVIVVAEMNLRDRGIAPMHVVVLQQHAFRQAVMLLVQARHHYAQPGPPALSKGYDDSVAVAQLLPLEAAANAPLDHDPSFPGKEEKAQQGADRKSG